MKKKKKWKKAKKPRQARKPGARTAAPAALFIPAIDSESRLLIVTDTDPVRFTAEQTVAIAGLLQQHYE